MSAVVEQAMSAFLATPRGDRAAITAAARRMNAAILAEAERDETARQLASLLEAAEEVGR